MVSVAAVVVDAAAVSVAAATVVVAAAVAAAAAAVLRPFDTAVVVAVLTFTLTFAGCLRDFFAGGSLAAPAEVDCVGSDVASVEANATLAAQFAAVVPSGFFVSDLERFSPDAVAVVVAAVTVDVVAVDCNCDVSNGDGIAGV